MMRIGLVTGFLVLLAACFANAQSDQRLERDSLDVDYADQLPRLEPTEPDKALRTFKIADGFRIELVASEPFVADPIAMAFDESGRLFVVEMRGYSENGDDHLGVIRLLTDSDKDGRMDKSQIYADRLSWPTAIACYNGGVIVAAAPEILYFKDGKKEVWFSGFSRNNVQGMVNSFRWGFDGLLYGSGSTNGGTIKNVRHPKQPSVHLRRNDFVIDPESVLMRAIEGGGQHGMSFDRWGDRFVSSNSDHIQWIRFEQGYIRRNPLLSVGSLRRSIAQDGPAAEVFRTSPDEAWRVVRTRLRVKRMVGGPIEGGGRPSGYFTGATGVTIYTGSAFGNRLGENQIAFIGDVGSNLVHCKRVVDEGAEKKAFRIHAKSEFLTSTDNWFRPVQFANGPDGALYILDMYREVIEHPLSLPPLIKKHLDLTSGANRGRIYRVVPKEFRQPDLELPHDDSDSELIAMLSHQNGWHRETAAQLLYRKAQQIESVAGAMPEGEARNFVAALRKSLSSTSPDGRIRSLYLLDNIQQLTTNALLRGLADNHPQVQKHAIRIAEGYLDHPQVVDRLVALSSRISLTPGIQLAYTLGGAKSAERLHALTMLLNRFGKNERLRIAALSSTPVQQLELLRRLMEQKKIMPREPIVELVHQISRRRNMAQVADTIQLLDKSEDSIDLLHILLSGVNQKGDDLVSVLVESGMPAAKKLVDRFVATTVSTIQMDESTPRQQAAAIGRLSVAPFDVVKNVIKHALAANQSSVVQAATAQLLSNYSDVEAGQLLIENLSGLSPAAKAIAVNHIISRETWLTELLNRIEAQSISESVISIAAKQRILKHPTASIRSQANQLFSFNQERSKVVANHQDILRSVGNPEHGLTLFVQKCATCHRLDEKGKHVGPDLQPLRNRGAEFFLTNILDPNRELDGRYEAYVVVTTEGRTFNGILKDDSGNQIILLQADGTEKRLWRADIEELHNSGKSLMPDGFEKELSRQQLTDLISYLISQ